MRKLIRKIWDFFNTEPEQIARPSQCRECHFDLLPDEAGQIICWECFQIQNPDICNTKGLAMTPDFNLCDICGRHCDTEARICVLYDRSMDAAGSMDDDSKVIDICGLCAVKAIKNLFLRNEINTHVADFKQGKRFLNYVQTETKKLRC